MNKKTLNTCFSGYLPTNGKQPIRSFENAVNYDNIKNSYEYGGVIKDNVVLIDVDDYEQSEKLMDIVEDLQLNCIVLETTRGKHFYFADSDIYKSNSNHIKLAIGITADIKRGCKKSMGIIKLAGEERKFIRESPTLDPIPVWLSPTKSELTVWKLENGLRNDTLYRYILDLEKAELSTSDIRKTISLINKFIILNPLGDSELQTILRDESFTKKTVDIPDINSGYELMQSELKPIEFIVKDLLPVGLSILASPPKSGKSWLSLDLSLSVSSGRYFLGNETKASTVYYLALEDSANRLQSRMRRLLGTSEPSKNFYYALNIQDLESGLIKQLQYVVNTLSNLKLIIIDTLQYIKRTRKKTEGIYDHDYNTMKQLKKFADDHELCILVIHHTSKNVNPTDPFANISGSYGITGACDTMMVLSKKERYAKQSTLSITGRDIEQRELILTYDCGKWSYEGYAEDVKKRNDELTFRADPLFNTINDLLSNNGRWEGTCQEILDHAEKLGYSIIEANTSKPAISLGMRLKNYDLKFQSYANITHKVITNGTGSKRHLYLIQNNTK